MSDVLDLKTVIDFADCPARTVALQNMDRIPSATESIIEAATVKLWEGRVPGRFPSRMFFDKASGCTDVAHAARKAKEIAAEIQSRQEGQKITAAREIEKIDGTSVRFPDRAINRDTNTILLISVGTWRSALELMASLGSDSPAKDSRPLSVREYLFDIATIVRCRSVREWVSPVGIGPLKGLLKTVFPLYENSQSRNCAYGRCPLYGKSCKSHSGESE